jgi:hypothetical protein
VHILADRDPARTANALTDDSRGRSSVDHLRVGDVAKAYLAGVDALRPRLASRPITGTSTKLLGPATEPLGD